MKIPSRVSPKMARYGARFNSSMNPYVALDNILDAHAACWIAERIYKGTAVRIPENPPVESRGLRMEMWR
jgi:predicted RNase H-like nuclease